MPRRDGGVSQAAIRSAAGPRALRFWASLSSACARHQTKSPRDVRCLQFQCRSDCVRQSTASFAGSVGGAGGHGQPRPALRGRLTPLMAPTKIKLITALQLPNCESAIARDPVVVWENCSPPAGRRRGYRSECSVQLEAAPCRWHSTVAEQLKRPDTTQAAFFQLFFFILSLCEMF